MTAVDNPAPDFSLHGHFCRKVDSVRLKGRRNVMVQLYPLDL